MLRYCVAAALMLAAIPAVAQPRPRDAVIAAAYRCSAIGAPRQWLDCYYGAAQPARAALGLTPAPQGQVQLSLSPPASAASPRIASVRDGIMASVSHCYATDDDRAWLECYYAAAFPMRSELGLSPGPQVAATPTPVPAPVPQALDNFGLKASRPARVDHLAARMVSYSFDQNHVFTVILANGQTWRQVSGDTHTAHWTKPADDYAVTIRRGLLSSYDLQVEGLPEVYKVDRVG